jgi:hypothetical protein
LTTGLTPSPDDFQPPTMHPLPEPEAAWLDPWGFLTDLEPVDLDSEHGPGILSLSVAQLIWAVGVLKARIEDLENERST